MLGILQDDFWKQADTITSVFVHISILLAAIAAAIKFRMLHLLSRRYKSELACRHHVIAGGQVVFEVEYTVNNTGERPIDLARVNLCLCAAECREGVLSPDQKCIFAERTLNATDSETLGLFHIEAGERSTFTLRTMLKSLEPVSFVLCHLSWDEHRQPAPYIGLYVREDGAGLKTQPMQSAKVTSAHE